MTLNLSAELESAITKQAHQSGTTPEKYVEQIVVERLNAVQSHQPPLASSIDEKLARLRAIARHCGVSPSNEGLSSEGLYD